jgi:hypothetical protein
MLSPEEKEKLRQEALEERERYRREQSIKDGSLEGLTLITLTSASSHGDAPPDRSDGADA